MCESQNTSFPFQRKITKEELQKLPMKHFSKEIVVIDNETISDTILEEIASNTILGFDTETRPSFTKGVIHPTALLQLGNSNKTWIFQLQKTGIPKKIAAILSSENIIKAGVAIRDDLKALKKIKNFTPRGFIELQDLVKEYGIEDAGLKKLCGIILGFNISKSKRLSNWEKTTLSPSQLSYAATDAWACALIFNKLRKIKKKYQ